MENRFRSHTLTLRWKYMYVDMHICTYVYMHFALEDERGYTTIPTYIHYGQQTPNA